MASLYPGAPAAVTASAKSSPPAKGPPKPPAKPTPTPVSTATQSPPFQGFLTPAQQIAQARQEAALKQATQVAALNRSAQETQAQSLAAQRTSQLGAQAVANILQGIAPATSAPYQQAAGADAAFAKGFSTGLSHVQGQMGDEASNILNVTGGQVQQPEVNAAIGGTNVTDPLYNLGGYIPATTLSREGAAFGAAAANLPAQALGIGQQGAQQARNDAAAALQKIAGQRADLAANLPALIDASLNRIGSQQLDVQKAAQAQRLVDARLGIENQRLAYQQAKDTAALKFQTAKFNAQQAASARQEADRVRQEQRRQAEADRAYALDQQKFGQQVADNRMRLKLDQNYKNAQLAQSDARLRLEAQRIHNDELKANALKAPRFDSGNSTSQGFRADQYGNPILSRKGGLVLMPGFKFGPGGMPVKITSANAPTRQKTFSAKDAAKYRGQAYNLADVGINGGTDAQGNPLKPITYEEAVQRGRDAGIPDSILLPILKKEYGALQKSAQQLASSIGGLVAPGLFGG